MSENKELNLEELDKINGGSNQIGNSIDKLFISHYLNKDIFAIMGNSMVFGELVDISGILTVKILIKETNLQNKFKIGETTDIPIYWKFYESNSN